MFDWLRKDGGKPLEFPDCQAAFEYACNHLDNRILLEALLPALVLEPGETGSEGERYFLLQLAGKDGGRKIWACTLKEASEAPSPGDLVGFRVVRHDPEMPAGLDLLGFIACGLAPEFFPGKGWRISINYTPSDIRPTVRW
jgi:hypothetical protein